MNVRARWLRVMALVLLPIAIGFASACNCLFGGEPSLEYMLGETDPEAFVALSFPPAQLANRLDESGHRHGQMSLFGPLGVEEASLDNDCRRAWYAIDDEGQALRIVGLEDDCEEELDEDGLVRLFKEEFVARLGGELAPLPAPDPAPNFKPYPKGNEPTLLLEGTLLDVRRRLDASLFFEHEMHGGTYYLAACGGRFRLVEERGMIRLVGIGYNAPCEWGDDACLESIFRVYLQREGDPTNEPSPTPIGTPTSCIVQR